MLLIAPPVLQSPAPPAAGAVALDLSQALDRARDGNPQILAAKARVQEREGLITTTRADALPQIALIGDFTRVRDVSLLNSGFGDSAKAFGLNPAALVGARNVYTSQATLSQPLFYWGKLGTAIKVAKMGEKEAGYAFTTTELDVLHGVAKAYLAVLAAQADLEVVKVRKEAAEKFLQDVQAKLEAQSATELDLLRAQSERLAVEPENLQAQANLQRALEVLNGQLGLEPKTPLTLAPLGQPPLGSKPAGKERSELAQLRQQEAMLRENDKILKADLRPKFDFNASYGYQAGKTNLLFQEPYDTWRVNVTMRFPIFDGLRSSGKRAQNAAQLEQVHEMRVDQERNIAVERSTADRELEKAVALNEAAERAHAAAAEALRVSRESFDQGLITSLDLLQAERAERQAESQRRRAQLGVWSALFDQRRSLGLPPL
ncbi:MAG TPA: TolC family protein [Holophagaceae bacterium]